MICQKKNKRLLVFCLSFLLFCLAVIPCLFSVESYASETTTQTVDQYFKEHNFYETCAYVCRKYASFPYSDYLTGANSGIIYDNFADYLESKGKSNLLQEDVIITGTGGGRGYDLPQDLRQEMVNFVNETYITQNPLSYKECYIYSYNFLNAGQFNSYGAYQALQNFIKNANGYVLASCTYNSYTAPSTNDVYLTVIPKTLNLGFYGTTNQGSFTNVQIAVNWQTSSQPWYISDQIKRYIMHPNGTIEEYSSGYFIAVNSIQNIATIPYGSSGSSAPVIFSNLDKNELVYVFDTINAYKNYNSNTPQSYYMPTNSQLTVPYYDGFTDSQLASAGNFYNNIVINTEGTSPTDTKKKTDSILGSLDSIFGGSDSESSSGGLFDSLGDIITGATGAISPIKEIVLGDIKELVADVFDFLPPTIITLWVSGIIFGIFFGVLKLIRG